jgi:hypothetical protein
MLDKIILPNKLEPKPEIIGLDKLTTGKSKEVNSNYYKIMENMTLLPYLSLIQLLFSIHQLMLIGLVNQSLIV